MINISREDLVQRSLFKKKIRKYLEDHDLIEIDLPCVGKNACPDSAVEPIELKIQQQQCFLQPSPEILFKRLLAVHPIDSYSFHSVFRDDYPGPLHNVEFLMLEFYLIGHRFSELKKKTVELCQLILNERPVVTYSYVDLWFQITKKTYHSTQEYFRELLDSYHIDYNTDWTTRTLEDLAFGLICQPQLGIGNITLIDHFPVDQAALACLVDGIPQRFELFVEGLELANGYDELISYDQNKERFEQWHQERFQHDLKNWPLDEVFLNSLENLPACSGVAIGIERLFMLGLNKKNLEESMVYHWNSL